MDHQHGGVTLMPADSCHDSMSHIFGDHGPPRSPEVASAVHSLIDMLTVVLGSLEQLHRQSLDERGQQQLDRAEWSAEHAGRLAHQILASASSPP